MPLATASHRSPRAVPRKGSFLAGAKEGGVAELPRRARRVLPYFFGAMLTVSVALVPSTVKMLVPTPTQMSFTSPGEEGKNGGRR